MRPEPSEAAFLPGMRYDITLFPIEQITQTFWNQQLADLISLS